MAIGGLAGVHLKAREESTYLIYEHYDNWPSINKNNMR